MPTRPSKFLAVLGFIGALAWLFRPLFVGKVLGAGDLSLMAIPDAAFLLECVRRHEWPLWTPYQRLGQPFAAALHTQGFYLPRLLAVWLAGPFRGITLEQVFHSALGGAGTYWACRRLGRSRGAAILSSVAILFAPLFVSLWVVPNMASAFAWTGVMLAATSRLSHARSLGDAALLAIAATGSFTAGSPETWLWQALLVGVVAGRRRVLTASGVLAFSLALSGVVLFPALELASETARLHGWSGSLDGSSTWRAVLALGWLHADLPRSAEDQRLLVSLFLGIGVLGLGLWGGFRRGVSRRLFLLAVGFAVLSLGGHFLPARWLFGFPPLSWFRYPVKYLVGAGYCLSIGAAFGLDRARAWARRTRRSRLRALGPSLLLIAGLELVLVSWLSGTEVWVPLEVLRRPPPRPTGFPSPTEGRASINATDDAVLARWPTVQARVAGSRMWLLPLNNVHEHVAVVEGYGPPELHRWVTAMAASEQATFDLAGVLKILRLQALGLELTSTSDSALPRAYLVQQVRSASDAQVLTALKAGADTLRWTAFVASATPMASLPPCESPPPVWRRYEPTRLELAVQACAASELIVTDTYFPGWLATVDGQEVPIRRAQFLVRAVSVPAGPHVVRMEYRPLSAGIGAAVSAVAWTALTLALATRYRGARPCLNRRSPP